LKKIIIALLLAGCGGNQSVGKVSIKLMDAPGDFKAAVVTITEVDLVGSGGVTALSTTATTTNLLSLANDTADLVAGATVEAGTYTELRFKISGGYVEVENAGGGTTIYASSPTYPGLPAGATVGGELQMPSFGQSGLKIDLPGGSLQVGTDAKVLLVDFDVQQSFGHDTGSGKWVMHPMIKASDFTLTGNLDVTLKLDAGVTLPAGVTLDSFDAVLTIQNGDGSTSARTLQLVSGAASFKYLAPGSNYSLGFQIDPSLSVPVSFTTSPAAPAPVTISSGQAASTTFVITSATSP
jgi:hypothetical protein